MMLRRRFDDDEEPTTATECGCRSCAAVMLADCIALGCCPCAVVSLLSLALVKAPFVVGRRCVGRLRRRRRMLLHKKRVRDVAAGASSSTTIAASDADVRDKATKVEVDVGVAGEVAGGADDEEELAWLEERYRMGHWGFGRVSSGKTP